jgi:predicted nucleotidyltransferase
LRRVIERYARAFAPERIVLFGSYAKGTNHLNSDLDLLVIADLNGDPVLQQRRARQLAVDCFPPVDVVFATPDDVTVAASAKSPFLLSILERGLVVYSRPLVRK